MSAKKWIEIVDSGEITKKQVVEAFQVALKENSAELAYKLALLPPDMTNRKVAEKIVLKAKNPYVCYEFARDIPGANVKAHEKICLESDDYNSMIEFASDVPNANTKAFETIILSLHNGDYSYRFLTSVTGASVSQHQKVITDSRDEKLIRLFGSLDIKGVNPKEISAALARCARSRKSRENKKVKVVTQNYNPQKLSVKSDENEDLMLSQKK